MTLALPKLFSSTFSTALIFGKAMKELFCKKNSGGYMRDNVKWMDSFYTLWNFQGSCVHGRFS